MFIYTGKKTSCSCYINEALRRRVNENSSKVLAFKDYLEYAKTGKVDKGEVNEHEADSDFEVFVGNYLREIALKLHTRWALGFQNRHWC